MLNYLEPDEGDNWAESGPNHTQARDNAILWARQILETDFVVLDTETTGLDPDDEAVSIGLVSKSGEVLLDTLLKHDKPSSPKALATHGISWEQTRQAPHFNEVLPDFMDKLPKQGQLVGYNTSFDLRILDQTSRKYGLPIRFGVDELCHDVMEQFARFYGEYSDWHGTYRWQKLTFAARYFGVETDGAHGVAADCLMTLKVLQAMAQTKLSTEDQEPSWFDVPPEHVQRKYDKEKGEL